MVKLCHKYKVYGDSALMALKWTFWIVIAPFWLATDVLLYFVLFYRFMEVFAVCIFLCSNMFPSEEDTNCLLVF